MSAANTTATDRPPPSDHTMAILLALATGRDMFCNEDTGRMVAVLATGKRAEIDGEALDELTAREWITVDDDTKVVATTETGAYWLERWRKKQRAKLRNESRPQFAARPRMPGRGR